ncbi:MAG: ribosomal protein S18-alanine N-acetyltransferase [Desulfobacterales bacterium]|jgi:ribosomal-protein-alanine N-acetyltransferase
MIEADLDAILLIERQSFQRTWPRSLFLGELNCENAYCYTLRRQENANSTRIIAYVCYRVVSDEMHLLRVAVAQQWRRRGIASRLIDECLTLARGKGAATAVLEVRPSNTPAISMYQKLGFQCLGRRPFYYSETREDALVLSKNLEEVL